MRKEIIKQEIMQTIGNYTIVKSVEQPCLYDGRRFGKKVNWYDVCLDGGNGDIVCSFEKLRAAKKWIKEN